MANRYEVNGKIIASLMQENTGRSAFDSGDFYGRGYERLAGKNLDELPLYSLSFTFDSEGEQKYMEASLSMYHFLKYQDWYYAPKMQAVYQRWYNSDAGEWGVEPFFKYLKSKGWEVEGYGGEDEPYVCNTYNGESSLDGHFIFGYFHATSPSGRTSFSGVMLSTHNGCDARSGYSRFAFFEGYDCIPTVYRMTLSCSGPPPDSTEPRLFDVPRTIVHHVWESDNGGYTWQAQGEYPCITEATEAELRPTADGAYHCPHCGTRLHLSEW